MAILFFLLPSLVFRGVLVYAFVGFQFSRTLRIYLCIGGSSLCLYSITEKYVFQDAKLYKVTKTFLWKIQKYILSIRFLLKFR